MVVVVGAGGEWELGWGDPLGVAVGEFAGGPAVVEEFVAVRAGEGECVGVGLAAVGPVVDVVDFGSVARGVAAGSGAAADCALVGSQPDCRRVCTHTT